MSARKSTLEKEFFTAIPQSLTIKQLLQVPSANRTIQHCKAIINHVKNVSFLERYMNSNEIYGIAKELQLKSYDARSTVFSYGEAADNFYIILSGVVKVSIPIPMQAKKISDLKEVMVLRKGEAFGELALLYDSVRSATVTTEENCEFIVLNKESFRKHIKTISTTHMSQIVEFYQDFPAFQSLPSKEIVKYASKSLFYKFPSNTVVIREGDQPEEIFFIKSGRVKVIRRLNFKINPITKIVQADDPSEPTKEEIERGWYKSMLIEIDELSTGDSFCDIAVLNKQSMHHSIVCSMPCELIALPHYDLNTMNDKVLSDYQAICKAYPDDTELRRAYLDLSRWNSWKKNLYKNVQIDKTNKRRGFDQQLREPFIKRIQLEKLTIPLETDIKNNLLRMINQTRQPQTTRAVSQNRLVENSTYTNTSRARPGDLSKQAKLGIPLLPKISNISATIRDTSINRHGSYSHREYKTSGEKLKFDFVVPKHKMVNFEEKETTTDGTGNEFVNYNEFDQMSNTELSNSQAKALLGFNLEEPPSLPAMSEQNLEEGDSSKKSGGETEGGMSVLGTRNIANTFTKVFTQMNLELPNLKKKYKVRQPSAF